MQLSGQCRFGFPARFTFYPLAASGIPLGFRDELGLFPCRMGSSRPFSFLPLVFSDLLFFPRPPLLICRFRYAVQRPQLLRRMARALPRPLFILLSPFLSGRSFHLFSRTLPEVRQHEVSGDRYPKEDYPPCSPAAMPPFFRRAISLFFLPSFYSSLPFHRAGRWYRHLDESVAEFPFSLFSPLLFFLFFNFLLPAP